jgi:hypothetical protein
MHVYELDAVQGSQPLGHYLHHDDDQCLGKSGIFIGTSFAYRAFVAPAPLPDRACSQFVDLDAPKSSQRYGNSPSLLGCLVSCTAQ